MTKAEIEAMRECVVTQKAYPVIRGDKVLALCDYALRCGEAMGEYDDSLVRSDDHDIAKYLGARSKMSALVAEFRGK